MRSEPMPQTPQPCERISVMLPGFVGEELADDQLHEVHTHLRDCVSCRREAADYMQANKALHRAAVAATVAHDVPFDDMHAEIMRRVTADEVVAIPEPQIPEPQWRTRLMLVAAAVLVASFGFWLGADPEPQSVFTRPGGVARGEGVVVVPYAGAPADVQPVGRDAAGGPDSGFGTGMAGRGVNRLPVEVLPAVHYDTK